VRLIVACSRVTLWTAKSELRYRAEASAKDFGYTKLRGFVMKSLAGIKLSKAHQVAARRSRRCKQRLYRRSLLRRSARG